MAVGKGPSPHAQQHVPRDAVTITMQSGKEAGQDETAKVKVKLPNAEMMLDRMLATLASRFTPESVLTIACGSAESDESSSSRTSVSSMADRARRREAISDMARAYSLRPSQANFLSTLGDDAFDAIQRADPQLLKYLFGLPVDAMSRFLAMDPVTMADKLRSTIADSRRSASKNVPSMSSSFTSDPGRMLSKKHSKKNKSQGAFAKGADRFMDANAKRSQSRRGKHRTTSSTSISAESGVEILDASFKSFLSSSLSTYAQSSNEEKAPRKPRRGFTGYVQPDGSIIYPNGSVSRQDGSFVLSNGTFLPSGRHDPRFPHGKYFVPDERVQGSIVKPDGTVMYPDGSLTLPNGQKVSAKHAPQYSCPRTPAPGYPPNTPMGLQKDGSMIYPDGHVFKPDGSVIRPDGIVKFPGPVRGYAKPNREIHYMDGAKALSDGSFVLPNGTLLPQGQYDLLFPKGKYAIPNEALEVGSIIHPNGNVVRPSGLLVLPNGKEIPLNEAKNYNHQMVKAFDYPMGTTGKQPNGHIVYPDGTVHRQDGSIVRPDGSVQEPHAFVGYVQPDRSIVYPDGAKTHPDNSFTTAQGAYLADGFNSKDFPRGRYYLPSIHLEGGCVVRPDGVVILPDHSLLLPNGQVIPPHEAHKYGHTPTKPHGYPVGSSGPQSNGDYVYPDGVVLQLNSTLVNPDGTLSVPRKVSGLVGPNESITYPDGARANPDGSFTLPNGSLLIQGTVDPHFPSHRYNVPATKESAGSVVHSDGIVQRPDGSLALPNRQTVSSRKAYKYGYPLRKPMGYTAKTVGLQPNGDFTYPNGDIVKCDGTIVRANGKVITPARKTGYVQPDGSILYPDAAIAKPNGTFVLPDGTELASGQDTPRFPEGKYIIPDCRYSAGSVVKPDGTVVCTDGSLILANGERVAPDRASRHGHQSIPPFGYPPGTPVGRQANGDFVYPDGCVIKPNGAIVRPDGSEIEREGLTGYVQDDGTVRYPDGSKSHPDGSFTFRDGTVIPQGAKDPTFPSTLYVVPKRTLPVGCCIRPDGTIMHPDGSIILKSGRHVPPERAHRHGYPNMSTVGRARAKAGVQANGDIIFPDGAVQRADGRLSSVNRLRSLSELMDDVIRGYFVANGAIQFSDGARLETDRSFRLMDGTLLPKGESDRRFPRGIYNIPKSSQPLGTVIHHEVLQRPDGSIVLPNGQQVSAHHAKRYNIPSKSPYGYPIGTLCGRQPNNDIVYPDGTVLKPDGRLIRASGTPYRCEVSTAPPTRAEPVPGFVVDGGAIHYPDGARALPNGSFELPDNTYLPAGKNDPRFPSHLYFVPRKQQRPGTVVYPDGTIQKPRGSLVLPTGEKVASDAAKMYQIPTRNPSNYAAGTPCGRQPNGDIVYPDGTVMKSDHSIVRPDGTRYPHQPPAEGTTLARDVSVTLYSSNTPSVMSDPVPGFVDKDGSIHYPDGACAYPDMSFKLPNGTYLPGGPTDHRFPSEKYGIPKKRQRPGTVIYPDGTIQKPNGSLVLPSGQNIDPQRAKLYDIPLFAPAGYPADVVCGYQPNGDVVFPDGTVMKPTGQLISRNGLPYSQDVSRMQSDRGRLPSLWLPDTGEHVFGYVCPEGVILYSDGAGVNADGSFRLADGTNMPRGVRDSRFPHGAYNVPSKPQYPGSILYPDGAIQRPDKSLISPAGQHLLASEVPRSEYPRGYPLRIPPTYPSDTMCGHQPNGDLIFPDGVLLKSSGELYRSDGSAYPFVISPHYPGGTPVVQSAASRPQMSAQDGYVRQDGTILYPDGGHTNPNGSFTLPNSTVLSQGKNDPGFPSHLYFIPDTPPVRGSILHRDYSVTWPDGSRVLSDNTILSPSRQNQRGHPDCVPMGFPNDDVSLGLQPNGDYVYPNGALLVHGGTQLFIPQVTTRRGSGSSRSSLSTSIQVKMAQYEESLASGRLPDSYIDENGTLVRYVEVPVYDSIVRQVPKKEIVYVDKRVPKIELVEVEKVVEVPVIETVIKEVELEELHEVIRQVPKKEIVDVPREVIRHVPRIETVVKEKVVEVPGEIIEVPKPVVIEKPIYVPNYYDKEVPTVVAQLLQPVIEEDRTTQEVEAVTIDPVLIPMDIFIPKPVHTSLMASGNTREEHRIVDIPPAQYNALVQQMNPHIQDEEHQRSLFIRNPDNSLPVLPVDERCDVIVPVSTDIIRCHHEHSQHVDVTAVPPMNYVHCNSGNKMVHSMSGPNMVRSFSGNVIRTHSGDGRRIETIRMAPSG